MSRSRTLSRTCTSAPAFTVLAQRLARASRHFHLLRRRGLRRHGLRVLLLLFCLEVGLEVGLDASDDVVARCDGLRVLGLDEHVLVGLHEEADRVARLWRRALGGRRHAHAVQVAEQAAVGPA